MAEIKIRKQNESTVFLDGNELALKELENYFTVKAPNFRFNPKYKEGYWDGSLKLFSTYKSTLPIGLVGEVRKFASRGGYSVECDFETKFEVDLDDFRKFVEILDPKLPNNNKPHNYQLAAVWDAITKKHISIEVPTSGGKTLIAYIIVRFLLLMNKKVLLIVNTTTLVEQCYKDWYDYGWKSVHENVHRIYGGQKKHFDAPVTISTWQSLYKDKNLFQIFDVLMIDEAHGAKASSLKDIGLCSINAEWRIGTSGTYPDYDDKEKRCDYFNIVGTLGPIKKYTTYQDMEQRGQVAKLEIVSILLKYPLAFRQYIRDNFREDFSGEQDAIHLAPERMDFVCKLINALDKNTLILFTKKEMHGLPLKKELEEKCPGKRVIYIDGSVKTDVRESTRAIVEEHDNLIVLASYGTFSTGISMKNIHYLVFASGYKSKIKVLQSIGRGLRRLVGKKEQVKVFDIVDDCSCSPSKDRYGNQVSGFTNSSLRHFKERKKIYEGQGFDWKSIVKKLE